MKLSVADIKTTCENFFIVRNSRRIIDCIEKSFYKDPQKKAIITQYRDLRDLDLILRKQEKKRILDLYDDVAKSQFSNQEIALLEQHPIHTSWRSHYLQDKNMLQRMHDRLIGQQFAKEAGPIGLIACSVRDILIVLTLRYGLALYIGFWPSMLVLGIGLSLFFLMKWDQVFLDIYTKELVDGKTLCLPLEKSLAQLQKEDGANPFFTNFANAFHQKNRESQIYINMFLLVAPCDILYLSALEKNNFFQKYHSFLLSKEKQIKKMIDNGKYADLYRSFQKFEIQHRYTVQKIQFKERKFFEKHIGLNKKSNNNERIKDYEKLKTKYDEIVEYSCFKNGKLNIYKANKHDILDSLCISLRRVIISYSSDFLSFSCFKYFINESGQKTSREEKKLIGSIVFNVLLLGVRSLLLEDRSRKLQQVQKVENEDSLKPVLIAMLGDNFDKLLEQELGLKIDSPAINDKILKLCVDILNHTLSQNDFWEGVLESIIDLNQKSALLKFNQVVGLYIQFLNGKIKGKVEAQLPLRIAFTSEIQVRLQEEDSIEEDQEIRINEAEEHFDNTSHLASTSST
jgi:hypothetical protein